MVRLKANKTDAVIVGLSENEFGSNRCFKKEQIEQTQIDLVSNLSWPK